MECKDTPKAWYDKAVGGFYLNYDHIPESAIKRGGIVPLYEPVEKDKDATQG